MDGPVASPLHDAAPHQPAAGEPDAGAVVPSPHAPVGPAPTGHVTRVQQGERTFYLVGTAHVSRKSVEEVRRVIGEVKPDTVCIELCKTRYETLTDRDRWRKLDIFQVVRQRRFALLLGNLALQGFQRRLGDKLGVRPGEEMLAAAAAAEQAGAQLVLADRDVQTTLRRTWANLSLWSKAKLLAALVFSAVDRQEVDEEQIEALKERDVISEMLRELARIMPQVKEPLIDERDQYLTSSVELAPGKTIVAVVGAGHIEGMTGRFGQPVDREALCRVPPPSRAGKVLAWLVPVVILAAFYQGYRQHAGEGLRDMLLAWIIPNALGAGMFAVLSGAKALSILLAALSAPLTTLNPTIGVGMVVGLSEAWLRRPTVDDCERLGDDIASWRGLWRNPFSRILIVAIATSIGAVLGAAVGVGWVLALL